MARFDASRAQHLKQRIKTGDSTKEERDEYRSLKEARTAQANTESQEEATPGILFKYVSFVTCSRRWFFIWNFKGKFSKISNG